MRDLLILAIHLVVTFVKLLRPGGVRAVVAESLALNTSCSSAIALTAALRISPRSIGLCSR